MQIMLFFVHFAAILFLMAGGTQAARPVYNIAHMVNTRAQIDEWLGYGANAIETDVSFDKDGTPNYLYHGFPCDIGRNCWRWDYVPEYIDAVRQRTVPSSPKFNPALVLYVFDVKLGELHENVLAKAARRFADIALIPLFSDKTSKLKVLISFADTTREKFIRALLRNRELHDKDIIRRIGFDMHSAENLEKPGDIEKFFKSINISSGHAWLSEGITNIFIRISKKKIIKELKTYVAHVNEGDGYISKVYAWTADTVSTMRDLLETGIDGIITNNPRNFNVAMRNVNKEAITDDEKLRLATLEDNPFKRL